MVQNEAIGVALLGPQGGVDVTVAARHYVLRVTEAKLYSDFVIEKQQSLNI